MAHALAVNAAPTPDVEYISPEPGMCAAPASVGYIAPAPAYTLFDTSCSMVSESCAAYLPVGFPLLALLAMANVLAESDSTNSAVSLPGEPDGR